MMRTSVSTPQACAHNLRRSSVSAKRATSTPAVSRGSTATAQIKSAHSLVASSVARQASRTSTSAPTMEWGSGMVASHKFTCRLRQPRLGRRATRPPPLDLRVRATASGTRGPESPEGKAPRPNQNELTNAVILMTVTGTLLKEGYQFETKQSLGMGLSLSERMMHVPQDVWSFYLHSQATHPLLVPAIITGTTYLMADWISQSFESRSTGRSPLDFDMSRMLRSGLVGFCLLGPLAHTYYTMQDQLFRLVEGGTHPWWDVPAHLALDQTLYTAFYNVVFCMAVGILRGDKADEVAEDIRGNFWGLMRAGWKLWPFVHMITYTVIPSTHKVLWVDAVELIWASILSITVNQNKASDAPAELEPLDALSAVVHERLDELAAAELAGAELAEAELAEAVVEGTPLAEMLEEKTAPIMEALAGAEPVLAAEPVLIRVEGDSLL